MIVDKLNMPDKIPHLIPFIIGLLCLCLQLVGLEEVLRFDRESIAGGQVWLLLSGNFVHLGWPHFVMNMVGLVLVYFIVWPSYSDRYWVAITLFSALGVGVGLYLFSPTIVWYVGFSGALHGLLLAGGLAGVRDQPVSSLLLLVAVIGKLVWEQLYGPVPGSESTVGGRVAVDSHLFGGVSGVIAFIAISVYQRFFQSQHQTRA